MQIFLRKTALFLVTGASALAMTSCFDDKYDLSDIDTTVRVQVKDLTIPVNIDKIELSSIIDLKSDGIVKEINDEYVILRDGSFDSKDINVAPMNIVADPAEPSLTVFKPLTVVAVPGVAQDIVYEIESSIDSPIRYYFDDVSNDIVEIDNLGVNWTISYSISINSSGNKINKYKFRNFVYQMPKGLEGVTSAGTYNAATGEISIPEFEIKDGTFKFSMTITKANAKSAGVIYNHAKHCIEVKAATGVKSGQLVINTADLSGGDPSASISVRADASLSNLAINSFSGKVKCDLNSVKVAPVKLNDLPDVLSQSGTDIRLVNPQIYLKINNPFSNYGLTASTGFAIDAVRKGYAPVHSSIDGGTFSITSAKESFYCLSPAKPEKYYDGYSSAEHVKFTSLSTAMSGDGLPSSIDINLDPTDMAVQNVTDFTLGTYPGVKGNYVFYAPLSLGKGSVIEYSSTEDGWNDEDVDKITISTLKVTASVSTNLPFDIVLTGYPVDVKGDQINNVEIEGAVVKANSTDAPVEITITGEVKHLDGVKFVAKATSESDAQPLSPSQTIVLNTVRATVKGWYDDEL